ncbi:hypothetical protein C8R48DRAFT_769706 [Suillus tomentosus]|nr:hypothetical protein C8R48DRAFT_769706 [Suillus tomentosus]
MATLPATAMQIGTPVELAQIPTEPLIVMSTARSSVLAAETTIIAKYPENSLPYFPTCESWTHALLPPKAAPYERTTVASPPHSGPTAHPRLRQTTLTSTITQPKQGPQPPALSNRYASLPMDSTDPVEDKDLNKITELTSAPSTPSTPTTPTQDSALGSRSPTPTSTPLWFPL